MARRLAACLLLAMASASSAAAAEPGDSRSGRSGRPDLPAGPVAYGPGREISRLANARITESSGVACGRANPGIFWTHNDSGDAPLIYALDREGKDLGTFEVEGAVHIDWEDMASFEEPRKPKDAPGRRPGGEGAKGEGAEGRGAESGRDGSEAKPRPSTGSGLRRAEAASAAQAGRGPERAERVEGPRGVLVIGDVGDNARWRKHCTLYLVEEPRVRPPRGDARTSQVGKAKLIKSVRFTFEDGPQNCESLGVDPGSRTVYLVGKVSRSRCKVYRLRFPEADAPGPAVAMEVATLTVPTTTGMDISPDGRRAVVLTYGHAYQYVRSSDETWADAFSRPARLVKLPKRPKGEAICYGADGRTLYLTTELARGDARTPLFIVPPAPEPPEAPSAEKR